MKNVEIRVWNTEDKDLVEVYINNELWFDKWTNDLFSVMNFICENIQDAEMKVKYMNQAPLIHVFAKKMKKLESFQSF